MLLRNLTTVDHHVEEAWVVSVVLAVHVDALQRGVHLRVRVDAALTHARLVSSGAQRHDEHVARLQVRVLQRQHALRDKPVLRLATHVNILTC